MPDRTVGLNTAAQHAKAFLDNLDGRPVGARVDAAQVREALGGPVPERGEDPRTVIDALVVGADPGLVASAGPRYFGFVTGGALPAALAADWLVSAWDQCADFHSHSPAAAAIEEVASAWTLDLLGLPATASVGFVTGGQGANTTCLAAARHAVLARAGWDVETDGLTGAPPVRILCGEQAHVTIFTALRLLGFGAPISVAVDDQGRMKPEALRDVLADGGGPAIVCAQAGNAATGAFDAFEPIADACTTHNAWLHIDGAFGLWAAAAAATRHLTRGIERADSWAVDAHKWLNVPYDAGMAIVADPETHVAAMRLAAPYLVADPGQRDGTDYVPECSRRARAVPVYAAIRSLGRAGIAELIERNCAQARRMAERLAAIPGATVLNDVVLSLVLLRLPGGDDANRAAVTAIQRDGTCWVWGTTWHGQYVLRVPFCNWATTNDDVDRSAEAITAAAQALTAH
ncbi:aspartate aminotransferase family protein [Mycobacterium sp. MFM001]|uniref:pyridoxal phosphate-dependent decarboxylase family protein n=1 Tax=Mycobacterium sp. MFM001 TaxID=2049453 RepID=UPI000DA5BD9D|nr:pyridoxal-dependent decarboxylase [Mycobacterium sp. MFM001]GBE67757.1 aspartate aminotransferase family protein [Mycobacterium sp. MFM001]